MLAALLKNHVAIPTVSGKFTTSCPLGDQEVGVGRRKGNIYFQHHKSSHPQSTKCYWSGKSLSDTWEVTSLHPEELPLARGEGDDTH